MERGKEEKNNERNKGKKEEKDGGVLRSQRDKRTKKTKVVMKRKSVGMSTRKSMKHHLSSDLMPIWPSCFSNFTFQKLLV